MDAHEQWCSSVIDSLDLKVIPYYIIAFGLPSPIIVSWAYLSLWKPPSSPKTPMIMEECREERERCGDGSENPHETCVGDLKKPRGFWRRTKKRLSNIFRAVCICGCVTRHTQ
uniref:Uncharacterized protein n=1 Tax=Schizaphis graminum TaxID=13262 RepID=A0A2S2NGX7_SCHGA